MSKADTTYPHVLPLRLYLGIGAALLFLTVLTVAVAQVHLGAFNLLVAMFIAGVKASLVALFFMHLKYDNKMYMVIFVGSLLFLAAFISFTMFDTETRADIYDVYNIDSGPIKPQAEFTPEGEGAAAHHAEDSAADSTAVDSAAAGSASTNSALESHEVPDSGH